MKNEIRLALLFMAATAVPSFAQNSSPQCGTTNFDQTRNLFTIMNPAAGTVNQQCFITVYQNGAMPSEASQNPSSYMVEGRYTIELSGGGGGGGGGMAKDEGGGGGGAGAAPSRTVQYLPAGVYKMTIGTGGEGGSANGGWTKAGNPTSLTNAYTGQLIAGFQGADTWTQVSQAPNGGRGGVAAPGGSSGGSGGDSGARVENRPNSEITAQSGGALQTSGYSGMAGQSGTESGRSDDGVVQANAGGGGGASVGSGGAGESVNRNAAAGMGDLGGGGGGGRGGKNSGDAGGRGGNGFIKLALQSAGPVAQAPAPAPAPAVVAREPAPAASQSAMASDSDKRVGARPAKKDRN